MLKIVNQPFDSKKMAIVLDETTEPILNYLKDHKTEKVTLRQIKRAFPEKDEMDRFIDDLVTFNLVERYHGAYSFKGNIITEDMQEKMVTLLTDYLDSKKDTIISMFEETVQQIPVENKTVVFLYSLFGGLIHETSSIYPDNDISKEWLSIPSRYTEIKGKKETFISMSQPYPTYGNQLSDFFDFLALNRDDLPKEFLEVRSKVGDVNQNYFMTYIERKLRRLEKGKSISCDKSDIFMETLYKMNYVGMTEDLYTFKIARMTIQNFDKWTECLNYLVERLESIDLATEEKEFIVRVVVYQWFVSENLIDTTQTLHGML
ncbi:DUF1803 domain-containing protein [Vagococcus carniphilus]|uniref:DUF1803 domain-containing protein n=1 Tax=Vagococcus carniphilus TaxID=218144 RepID=UPI0028900117|nr:DUF1803 domain-containing protein [Vagococcus carniphilus]MDT2848426.1 DUF1803 domain-containing protein [Vagococcus carniphilus]